MANTSKSRSSGSSSKSPKKSTAKKPVRSTTSKRAPAGSARKDQAQLNGFAVAFNKFASSKAAMPLIFIAAVILIVGIDLLVSLNSYGTFFKILGIEILIAVLVWVILTLVFSRKNTKDPDSSLEDEV